ncbi:hypothetical protein GCM10027168_58410 [Streptomyces capparidis]
MVVRPSRDRAVPASGVWSCVALAAVLGILLFGWYRLVGGLLDPALGQQRFDLAREERPAAGQGRMYRYMVRVEQGVGLAAEDAADEVAAVLADPRGWTARDGIGFRLVDSGTADFAVTIATPRTVDEICGAAGLETRGEVNCRVGSSVVVNLKRWREGSPTFDGPIGEYRALIVNHEVGHWLGHGHQGCPSPGSPAPVMMQQIKGLDGCVPNAWPHDRAGRLIRGPAVP